MPGDENEGNIFLSTAPTDRRDWQIAVAVVAVSVVIFAATAPFARTQWPTIPAFIPVYESAVAVNDMVTAILLLGQFNILRTRALLLLASGYLFTAAMAIVHALSFPGLFSDTGLLGAGPQTTAWLYMFWHGGFPLLVCAYAVSRRQAYRIASNHRVSRAIVIVFACIALLTTLATAGHNSLPAIMVGNHYTPIMIFVVAVVCVLPLVALGLLLLRRPLVKLDLWLAIVMVAWLFDVALSAMLNAGRFDVGFYVGRIYGLFAASFVLGSILIETNLLYSRLAVAANALRRHAGALEQRVSETAAELRESEGIAGRVLETAMSAYVRMDEGGRITEWNTQAERTFGWPRAEAIGRLLSDTIVPPDLREAHNQGLDRFLATGEGRLLDNRVEMKAVRRDGETFPIEIAITAIKTEKGYVFSAFLRDISERKRAEQQLQQAQKLEAVGQLTAGIAHDFNNLLSVVIGNLDLVLEDPGLDPEKATNITRALKGALHGAELTHRLLAFARQQSLEPKSFSINDMLQDVVGVLRRTLGESIKVDLQRSADLWPVFADPSQVQDAVLNLAINARDAMPLGGTITIETANVTLDEDYARSNPDAKSGDYAQLAVTDDGTGMTPEVLKHVVEPFFTTKPEGKGTGLGLSMIYGFARQSGGHLKIYSEVGHGTSVKLYLPRAATLDADLAPEAPQPSLPRGHEAILVVEDNAELRHTAVIQLSQLGYRVIGAENAEAALVVLRGGEPIDLVFSDMVMTGPLTGQDLAREARIIRPSLLVLLTTGYAEKGTDKGSPENWPLLRKPYRRQELALKVRSLLDQAES